MPTIKSPTTATALKVVEGKMVPNFEFAMNQPVNGKVNDHQLILQRCFWGQNRKFQGGNDQDADLVKEKTKIRRLVESRKGQRAKDVQGHASCKRKR